MILDDLQPLTIERTLMRLVALAAARGGSLLASDVERDDQLADNPALTTAAAEMLAQGAGVEAEAAESASWFPFKLLTLTDLPQPVEPEP